MTHLKGTFVRRVQLDGRHVDHRRGYHRPRRRPAAEAVGVQAPG